MQLFLASVASLYTEIMLIRWISTEVRIFAYFQNLALITCFLGFGLGCYWSQRKKSPVLSLMSIACLVALVKAPVERWQQFLKLQSSLLALSSDAAIWTEIDKNLRILSVFPAFVAAALVMACFLVLLVAAMIPLGQIVGCYLESARNAIEAYSVNLVGSVLGLWILAGLSFLWLPPLYWFAFAFLFVVLIQPSQNSVVAGMILIALTLIFLRNQDTDNAQTYWSPYQKLRLEHVGEQIYNVSVNNTGYMTISNLTPEFLRRYPDLARNYRQSSYDAPFRFASNRGRVLILGAGAGNDAAAALRNGAAHVDSIEIDPVIYDLGKRFHPEQPYNAPNVRTIVQDARAFLNQSQEKYDIILFGLLDSHTEFSNYSNMRIDNYVYTEEAFRNAQRLLKPDGILILKFEVRAPWTWMGQRFYTMLVKVFGRNPIVFFAPRLGPMLEATVFVSSNSPKLWSRAANPDLAALVAQHPPSFPLEVRGAPPPATDDWPYVYHRSHSIPRAYLVVSLILLLVTIPLIHKPLEPRQIYTWHFFLLGAGFLLLETQMVSRLALYFGTTWLVTSTVITAILLMLVLANLYVAAWHPTHLSLYNFSLVISLLANYVFPWDQLPYSTRTVGFLMLGAYSVSIFLAGVIFTEAFQRSMRRSNAFGANIVGAVAGGLSQNVSFIFGMKALLLLAALLYGLAALTGFLNPKGNT